MSDHELAIKYKKEENPEIIGELFTRYTHLVYGICLNYLEDRDEAKDAVMEIFESLFINVAEFEIHNFKNWLYSVARNHCLMELRKKKQLFFADLVNSEDNEGMIMESPDELHQELEMDEYTLNELALALKELKEHQRRCLELVYLQDKTYQEVCEITGLTPNEVKSHIQNGKRNLKIKLESRNAKEY